MYITIDGLSGAGKSEQAERICERLDWDLRSIDDQKGHGEGIWKAVYGDCEAHRISKLIYDFSLIRGHIEYARDAGRSFILVDSFYRLLWAFHRENKSAPTRFGVNLSELIELFQNCLSLCRGALPDASFYLHVPATERHLRQIRRDEGFGLFEIKGLELTTGRNTDEDTFYAMFEWLSAHIPKIYIIDGTQPIDAITDTILGTINELDSDR